MSHHRLRARAKLYASIRTFFNEKAVLEVDVPLLSPAATTDPHIHSCAAQVNGQTLYLQTSPEFYLKRLLSEYPQAIYSLGKAFRNEESGRNHRAEFTLLEWYRPGFSLSELIDEVCELITRLLPHLPFVQSTYQSLFEEHLGFNPHRIDDASLATMALNRVNLVGTCERQDYLDLLMTHVIEPCLPSAIIISDYPCTQAALARIEPNEQGQRVAKRFEIYVNQRELANGYWELIDSGEQARRFENDNAVRQANGLPVMPVDSALIEALDSGIPACSGVAVGVDRLLMLISHAQHIDEVMSF
ncbi:EF-P lysine aminoacylase EpmA [bacterium]|nr:EF-P lysine aminoacylase EpmA [bacterium]